MLKIPKCDIITKTEKELLKLAMNCVLEFLEAKKKLLSFTSLIREIITLNLFCFVVGFFCFFCLVFDSTTHLISNHDR